MGSADLVFVSGDVFTAAVSGMPATAVAVDGGRIVAVGHAGEATEWIGPATEVVDLDGRMLLPGFQDAHIHPPQSGLELSRCSLYDVADATEAATRIASYAAAHPDEPWILGGGWAMDWYPAGTPSADELDRLVPDRPAYLRNRDGHGAWVNRRALGLAGIDASTPDPSDGRIERLGDGSPQGTLHEGAMDAVAGLLPPPSASDYAAGLEMAQELLVALGITGWQDAMVDPAVHDAYRAVAGAGRLVVDVVGALWWERERDLDQVEELIERRRDAVPGYRPTTVKIMLDGVAENHTAALLEPYLDASGRPSTDSGLDFVEPGALARIVTRLDAEGFQVHFHAIGDRAVGNALDAVEAARRHNGWTDGRHHIAHIQLIHPDDLPRFRRLGVVATAQPYWACLDRYQTELTIPFLGPDRAARQYPFASLRRAGAWLAMGSDWSVSTANPLEQIEVAVTRVLPDRRTDDAFYPHERLSLQDALTGFTIGSAFVNHCDDRSGTVEAGKEADLVVLDRSPFDPGAGPIGDAAVDMTIIGGGLAYLRDGAA